MLLLLLFVILSEKVTPKVKTLKFLNTIYRHGDRSPIYFYGNEAYWEKVGHGKLTNNGMIRHFELGKYLKQKYTHLFGELSMSQVTVYSSDADRTIMSALANLAGLFPPTGTDVWNPSLLWHPFPVHTIPEEYDNFLRLKKDCPAYTAEKKKLDSYYQKVNQNFSKNFITKISNLVGHDFIPYPHFDMVLDTLICEKSEGLPMPAWLNDEILDEMTQLSIQNNNMEFANKKTIRLHGGVLVKKIIQTMKDVRDGTYDSSKKAIIYSGHDQTVKSFLGAMGLFHGLNPSFAACLMVELHEISNEWYVKIIFRLSDSDIQVLQLPGCDHLCQLDKFEVLLLDIIPGNIDEECQI